jgi:hypothetical protein
MTRDEGEMVFKVCCSEVQKKKVPICEGRLVYEIGIFLGVAPFGEENDHIKRCAVAGTFFELKILRATSIVKL